MMNKANKHNLNGIECEIIENSISIAAERTVLNSVMSFLPDNRPITSLLVVEDFEKCPKHFYPINRTYDQDADADLWRDNSILFGRQSKRYMCLSKTEGLPNYVIESLKIIADKVKPPGEYSLLSRTVDSDQKAWRKRQLIYKLGKCNDIGQAVTDIILCSKLKIAPNGFKLAGDINGMLVCFKTISFTTKLPLPIPGSVHYPEINHDYEEIESSVQKIIPQRPAPKPPHKFLPKNESSKSLGTTIGSYSDLDGVPFTLNALLINSISEMGWTLFSESKDLHQELEYDFQLERQILCTMKSLASKNPFFK